MSIEDTEEPIIKKRRRYAVGENGITEIGENDGENILASYIHANRRIQKNPRPARPDSTDHSKQIKLRVNEWPNDCLSSVDNLLTCTACHISLSSHKSHVRDHVESRRHCELVAKIKYSNINPSSRGIIPQLVSSSISKAAAVSGSTTPNIFASSLRELIPTCLPLNILKKCLLQSGPTTIPPRAAITNNDMFHGLKILADEELASVRLAFEGKCVSLLVNVCDNLKSSLFDIDSIPLQQESMGWHRDRLAIRTVVNSSDNSNNNSNVALAPQSVNDNDSLSAFHSSPCTVVVIVRWLNDLFELQHRVLDVQLLRDLPSISELSSHLSTLVEPIKLNGRTNRNWTLPGVLGITLRAPGVFWKPKSPLLSELLGNFDGMNTVTSGLIASLIDPSSSASTSSSSGTIRAPQMISPGLDVKLSADVVLPTFTSIPTLLQQSIKYVVANCMQSFWVDINAIMWDSSIARKYWYLIFKSSFGFRDDRGSHAQDVDLEYFGAKPLFLQFLAEQFVNHPQRLLSFVICLEEYNSVDSQPTLVGKINSVSKWIRDPTLNLWLTLELNLVATISKKLFLMAEMLGLENIPSSMLVADTIDVITNMFWSESVPLMPNRQMHFHIPELNPIISTTVNALTATIGSPFFSNPLLAKEEVYGRARHLLFPVSEFLFRSLGSLHILESSTYKLARLLNPYSLCRMQSQVTKRDEVLSLFHNMPVFTKSLGVFADYVIEFMQGELDAYARIVNANGGYHCESYDWLPERRSEHLDPIDVDRPGDLHHIRESNAYFASSRVIQSEMKLVTSFWVDNENQLVNLSRLARYLMCASPSAEIAATISDETLNRLQLLVELNKPKINPFQGLVRNTRSPTTTHFVGLSSIPVPGSSRIDSGQYDVGSTDDGYAELTEAAIPVDSSEIGNGMGAVFDVDSLQHLLQGDGTAPQPEENADNNAVVVAGRNYSDRIDSAGTNERQDSDSSIYETMHSSNPLLPILTSGLPVHNVEHPDNANTMHMPTTANVSNAFVDGLKTTSGSISAPVSASSTSNNNNSNSNNNNNNNNNSNSNSNSPNVSDLTLLIQISQASIIIECNHGWN